VGAGWGAGATSCDLLADAAWLPSAAGSVLHCTALAQRHCASLAQVASSAMGGCSTAGSTFCVLHQYHALAARQHDAVKPDDVGVPQLLQPIRLLHS
jgi:hypothetical protein